MSSSETDQFVDRRRLKRQVIVWRATAILAGLAIGMAAIGQANLFSSRSHVALLSIDGLILSNPQLDQMLYDLAEDHQSVALVINIDSPGGETAASESLYRALLAVAEVKPVVAVMRSIAASGGYMVALAADQIFARESTITGSIGVVLETTNVVGLMEMIGVENEFIRSGPLKAQPNPLERLTPDARAANQSLVDDTHSMFKRMVAERRNLELNVVEALGDGRVFSGAAARSNGLIDALGGMPEARIWLSENFGVARTLPQRDLRLSPTKHWLDWLLSIAIHKSSVAERLGLDGLVSVWQPSSSRKW